MTTGSLQAERVVPLTFRNTRDVPMTFVVEPWADEYRVEPQSEIRLEFTGPDEDSPLIEWGEDTVTAYGWSGSTVRVFIDGQER